MDNLENKKYWIWISLIQNLGSKRLQQLLKKYKTLKKIYELPKIELMTNRGIGEQIADNILNKNIRKNVEIHFEYMKRNNIHIVTIEDEEYPQILKQIYDPPMYLYAKGDISTLNNKSVGIVGCRDASDYGKKAAKYFAYNLSKQGINVVSGLAKGIDSYAHIGCICGGGKTIGIIGSGLDEVYPKENLWIYNEIIKSGGAIISEYPMGIKPAKNNFPARNRIISGMCNAIIVVEAKEKSGTLITVDFALEQGRDVYVVPGNINSKNSVGTNDLIRHGAKMACCCGDICID